MHKTIVYKPTLGAVLKEAVRGKAVSRTMTNLFWCNLAPLSGLILDIGGGGGRSSHYRFLRLAEGTTVKCVDVIARPGTDFVLDVTKERVPLPDASVDAVFLFNILEHLSVPERALQEAWRVLKNGGRVIGSIPFLVNVHRDPEDFFRLTDTALTALFEKSGFRVAVIESIGRGPFLAAYEQLDMLLWIPLHLLFLPFVWMLDAFLAVLRPQRDFRAQFPLAYNFIVEKQ